MDDYDLITELLPVLGRSSHESFNVFNVMHHGTHEKQLSNIFRWILDIGGSHRFETLGQRVFLNLIRERLGPSADLPDGPYSVRQEVNTAESGHRLDIADLVLENDSTVVVVENYETSDGHGHSYNSYLKYGQRDGKFAVVVLLFASEYTYLQADGWERATVITYERFLDRLMDELNKERNYAQLHTEQYSFLIQMHRKFAAKGDEVSDSELLAFIDAMCVSGEARRYRERPSDVAAEKFASDVAERARERFEGGREVLKRVKDRLKIYARSTLHNQLDGKLRAGSVREIRTNYVGIYQWIVELVVTADDGVTSAQNFEIRFGPTAWNYVENESDSLGLGDGETVDYSKLFIASTGKRRIMRQSQVSLLEVLHGLSADDYRLRDEILALDATS
ncbi:PD-(D/E)XK nuclease family protein [Neomicrococcus lactis]